MEKEASAKRRDPHDNDEEGKPPAKKTRFQDMPSEKSRNPFRVDTKSTQSEEVPTFLLVSLQMLKSLYDLPFLETDGEGGEDGDVFPEDGEVEEQTWELIREFIHKRDKIGPLNDTARYYGDIHDGAIEMYEEEQEMEKLMKENNMVPSEDEQKRHPTSSLFVPTPSPRKETTSFAASFMPPEEEKEENKSAAGYRLITGVLKMKLSVVAEQLVRIVEPFLPLEKDVDARIKRLDSIHKQLMENQRTIVVKPYVPKNKGADEKEKEPDSSPDKRRTERRDEFVARVKTKLRLWKELHADLTNTLPNQDVSL